MTGVSQKNNEDTWSGPRAQKNLPGVDRDRVFWELRDADTQGAPMQPAVERSNVSDSAVAKFRELLSRRRWIIATTMVFGLALCLALGAALPRTYAAKALLLVGSLPAQSGDAGRAVHEAAEEVFIQTEMSTLGSRQHLRAVVAALDVSDPEVADMLARVGWLRAIGNRVSAAAERLVEDPQSGGAAPDSAPMDGPLAAPSGTDRRERQMDQVERNLRITQELRSRIISVRYTAPTPDAAALIANTMVNVHVDDQVALAKQYLQRELDWTDRALAQEKIKLDQANHAVSEFIASNIVPDDTRTRTIEQQTFALRNQLSTAQADLETAIGRAEQVRHLQSRAGDWDYLATKSDFPRLMQLALAAKNPVPPPGREPESIQAGAQGTGSLRSRHEKAKLEIANALDETERELQDRVLTATARRDAAQKALSSIEASRVEGARIATAIADLRKKAADAHAAYQSREQIQSRLQERLSVFTPGLRMLSAATPPLHPSSPHPLYFIPPALVASLILGCVLALAVDLSDRRMRTRSDVEAALAIPCIGALPRVARWRARSLGRAGGLRRNDRAASAVRSLALACLRRGDRRDRLRAIAVVSPSIVEDAADLAAALAWVTQSFGRRTLYLDCHRSRWSLPAWGGAKRRSLSDVLEGRCNLADAVQSSPGKGGPDVLGGSTADLERLDAFADGRISTFLGKLAGAYDLVVIHAASLQESVAASWIAAEADLILFVVRSGVTDGRVAATQLQQLRSSASFAPHPPEIVGILDHSNDRSST